MNKPHTPLLLVGYDISMNTTSDAVLWGKATMSGDTQEHELHYCVKPIEPIDIGRDVNGDLVWISDTSHLRVNYVSLVEPQPSIPVFFEPAESTESDTSETKPVLSKLETIMIWMNNRKKLLTISSMLSGICVVIFLIAMSGQTSSSHNEKVIDKSVAVGPEEPIPTDPTQAAIEFVLSGTIPGVTLPEGVREQDLVATEVSHSGEIVLVDVQINQDQGLTTFATLLLQKSGTAWRIREVFDPR